MTIKFEKIQDGQTLWERHSYKVGNTTMRAWGVWRLKVLKKDDNGAEVSWNGNPPRYWHRPQLEKCFAADPSCKECRKAKGHKYGCSIADALAEKRAERRTRVVP